LEKPIKKGEPIKPRKSFLGVISLGGYYMKLLKELNCNDVLIGIFEVEDFYEIRWKDKGTDWRSFEDERHCSAEYNTLEEAKRFIKRGTGHPEEWDKLLKI